MIGLRPTYPHDIRTLWSAALRDIAMSAQSACHLYNQSYRLLITFSCEAAPMFKNLDAISQLSVGASCFHATAWVFQ
jgi:hypothetical protein